ncbi:MAG: tetratricopeptide repeat protein [Spirochaetes bacterium]|nr:tetratricopeptide repeat protein [Spirochaetota bacterium]MBN2772287.1 tetratricopeptide repeat protein [Spirochaetota bacterium]
MAVIKEKPEPVTYSAEELAEIERIVGTLPGSTEKSSDGTLMSLNDEPPEELSSQPDQADYSAYNNDDLEDLALEPDSLIEEDGFEVEELNPDDSSENISLDADDLSALPELDDSSISFDIGEQEPSNIEPDIPFDLEDEINNDDISALPDEDISLDNFDDISTDLPSDEGLDELGAGFDLSDADDDAVSDLDDGSMMDQLNDLTADEGDSIDLDDLADDEFLSASSGLSSGDSDDSVSIDGDDEMSLPDLNSLDMDDSSSIEEGDLTELPNVGFDDLDSDSVENDAGEVDDFSDQDIDIGLDDFSDDISELPDIDQADRSNADDIAGFDDMDDIGAMPIDEDIESSSILDDLEQVGTGDSGMSSGLDIDMPEIEPVDDHISAGGSSASKSGDSLELSTDELNKIKKSLLLYPAGLTAAVKDTILNDRLSPRDTRRVVDMILEGRPDHNIHRFLEKKLGKAIDLERGGVKRRVILSRPEYSSEGRARQKILLRRTRNIGLGMVLIAVLSAVGYRTLYIPYRANALIAKGTELIRRHNEPKFPDYKEAEQIFQRVHDDYISNYIRAYNEYGRAYFDRKQYMESLLKLNRGYELVSDNFTGKDSIQLLNNLGYFYSSNKGVKFDDFFNKSIKKNLDEWYFKKLSRLEVVNNQYDLAIDFYKKALSRDSKNMQALLGIGDVYMNQGEFLKARTYYENILKIDPDSVAGHSGLFNLFVERDNFPEAVSVYVNLRNKGMLENVPSPLLAKGANYFLGKAKSDKQNIRIDYGIESPRLKDINDQPFPVVVEILKALRNKDPDYPPLYVAYARLSIKEGNFRLAKEYLENGMRRSEKAGYSYFAGNHLLGEYYYYTRQPALSFKHFKQALADYSNPPEYAFEPYYKETENPGNTNAMLGNIFYYFFDRVKYQTGDQEMMTEMDLRKNEELMGNFSIARSYYERALEMGFESPELHYNLGRVYYLNGEYSRTRDQWLNLYDEFTVSPELMLGLGNVFYKMGNYEAAKAQFMKLTSIYEYEAESIYQVVPDNREHKKIFQTLATAYNNLGAVYQQQNILDQSAICYWNSIELSRKIGEESAFARVNLGRGVKEREMPAEPIFDDNIPYSISYYTEEMRWSR